MYLIPLLGYIVESKNHRISWLRGMYEVNLPDCPSEIGNKSSPVILQERILFEALVGGQDELLFWDHFGDVEGVEW